MIDPNMTYRDKEKMVDLLAAGLHVDPTFSARGPLSARKTLLGRFQLDSTSGSLHVANVASEADRTCINSAADSGYFLRWERDGKFARVYYDPQQKAAQNA